MGSVYKASKGSSIVVLLMICILLITVVKTTIAKDTDRNTNAFPLLVREHEYKLSKGNEVMYILSMSDILSNRNITKDRNVIEIQFQTRIIRKGGSNMQHLVDVKAQVAYDEDTKDDPVDIKDFIRKNVGQDIILHYIVYELCDLTLDSTIELTIKMLDGEAEGFYIAKVIDTDPFSIQCVNSQSEVFKPREQHGSCVTWDGSIWVYGGIRNIDKQEVALNDIMAYDAVTMKWRSVEPSTDTEPEGRYGHSMMCYYNYIIIFGGQNSHGEILGDLWAFDTVKENWVFIMDTNDTFELGRMGAEGVIPAPRTYAATVTIPEIAAGYIFGGLTPEVTACDLWILSIDQVMSYIEDNQKNPIYNFWRKEYIKESDHPKLCRQGHSATLYNLNEVLIYGGLDGNRNFAKTPLSYNIDKGYVTILGESGDTPLQRIKNGMLAAGNGMVIMYGGKDPIGEGYLTDVWHLKINNYKIEYDRYDYKNEDDQKYMNWRKGFTMHYVRNIEDPIVIGGTYGNNQQSHAILTLPERKCISQVDFMRGDCAPCPKGSILSSDGKCEWCKHSQYFVEYKDYFKSKCFDCPEGLVGGHYRECVPCDGGSIYDSIDRDFCRECDSDKICPVGTRYEFPVSWFSESFEKIKIEHSLEALDLHTSSINHSPTFVMFTSICCALVLVIVVALILLKCKAKALLLFTKIDRPSITGGTHKSATGGIIMFFFIIISCIATVGFIVNYFLFNSKAVFDEKINPSLDIAMKTSFLFRVDIFMSKFMDIPQLGKENLNYDTEDLCKNNKIRFKVSRYFSHIRNMNEKLQCTKESLSNGTDKYSLSLMIKNVQYYEAPNHAFVRFIVDSDYTQIVHFFKWEYWNIWQFYGTSPLAYSKISGYTTPQKMYKNNQNITTGFKGPKSTKIFYKLKPTHYYNKIEDQGYEGYQVYVDEVQRGSTVNKRNMVNEKTPDIYPNSGFDLELVSSVGDTLYTVHVENVRGIIETTIYIFGFIAVLMLVSFIMKKLLSKENYFKSLEREYRTIYGTE